MRYDWTDDWTERDIRETTVDPDEIRVAYELIDKKNQLIENLSLTVDLLEYQRNHLRGLLLSWKVFGWCGWGVVGLCIWRGLAR